MANSFEDSDGGYHWDDDGEAQSNDPELMQQLGFAPHSVRNHVGQYGESFAERAYRFSEARDALHQASRQIVDQAFLEPEALDYYQNIKGYEGVVGRVALGRTNWTLEFDRPHERSNYQLLFEEYGVFTPRAPKREVCRLIVAQAATAHEVHYLSTTRPSQWLAGSQIHQHNSAAYGLILYEEASQALEQFVRTYS